MERIGLVLAFVVLFGMTGCETDQPRVGPAGPGEPSASFGYDPDTLAWFREGREVRFGGRGWRPAGEAVFERREALRRVGQFEGMELYAAADAQDPYDILFFPYSPEIWQPLEPID